jgi:hypothetical protein
MTIVIKQWIENRKGSFYLCSDKQIKFIDSDRMTWYNGNYLAKIEYYDDVSTTFSLAFIT